MCFAKVPSHATIHINHFINLIRIVLVRCFYKKATYLSQRQKGLNSVKNARIHHGITTGYAF